MKQLFLSAILVLFTLAVDLESLASIDSPLLTNCHLATTDNMIGVQCEERIVIYYHQEEKFLTLIFDEPIVTRNLAKTYAEGLSFVRVDNETLSEYTLVMFTKTQKQVTQSIDTTEAMFLDETTFATNNIQHSNLKFFENGVYQAKIVLPAGISFAAAGTQDSNTGTIEIIACDVSSLDCQYWEITKNPF